VVAATSEHFVTVSTDGGATRTRQEDSATTGTITTLQGPWKWVPVSADGEPVVAGGNSGPLFTAKRQ